MSREDSPRAKYLAKELDQLIKERNRWRERYLQAKDKLQQIRKVLKG